MSGLFRIILAFAWLSGVQNVCIGSMATVFERSFSSDNDDYFVLAENAALLQSNGSYNYLDVLLNNNSYNLLFDINTPILWHYPENTKEVLQNTADFSLKYSSTYQISGKYLGKNNLTIANISLQDQYFGTVESQEILPSLGLLDGIFGHSYFNPILGSLNTTSMPTVANIVNGSSVSGTSNTYVNQFVVLFFSDSDKIQLNSHHVDSSAQGLVLYGQVDDSLVTDNIYFTAVLDNSDYFWLIGISVVSQVGASDTASQQILFPENISLDNGATISNASRAAVFDLSMTFWNESDLLKHNNVLLVTSLQDATALHDALFGKDNYQLDNSTSEFYIDCNESSVLQVNIGANFWNITKNDYVGIQAPNESIYNGKCVSNIKTYHNKNSDFNSTLLTYNYPKIVLSNYWILGAKFCKDLLVVFDVDQKLVGLSRRKTQQLNIVTDHQMLQEVLTISNSNVEDFQNDNNNTSNTTHTHTGNQTSDITIVSSIFTESVSLSYASGYQATTTVVQSLFIIGTQGGSNSGRGQTLSSSSSSSALASFHIGNLMWCCYLLAFAITGIIVIC